jgi:hypothetical protein
MQTMQIGASSLTSSRWAVLAASDDGYALFDHADLNASHEGMG